MTKQIKHENKPPVAENDLYRLLLDGATDRASRSLSR